MEYKSYLVDLIQNKPKQDFSLGMAALSIDLLNPTLNRNLLKNYFLSGKVQSLPIADPFVDEKVLLPFKSSHKSEDFFNLVETVSKVFDTSVLRNPLVEVREIPRDEDRD